MPPRLPTLYYLLRRHHHYPSASIRPRAAMLNMSHNTHTPPISPSPPSKPLVVIIGSTGTGKSNLAVSLARSLPLTLLPQSSTSSTPHQNPNFEIINADAMQLYTGAPIITNKIPISEQGGIPHHLLGQIGLDEETWTVQDYVKRCDEVCDDIRARGNVPIVVGGTGYYVHGLVLGGATLGGEPEGEGRDEDGDKAIASGSTEGAGQQEDITTADLAILDAPTAEIYAKLQEVDPVMAQSWHPNDRRKIQRSLEIYLRTGRKASDVYAEQKARKTDGHNQSEVDITNIQEATTTLNITSSHETPRMRHDTLIFWLEAEDTALKERLNARVDNMVRAGLLSEAKELAEFQANAERKGTPVDKKKGIWVSIGYKELEPWLDYIRSIDNNEEEANKKNDEEKETSKSSLALQQSCIYSVKTGTHRYAKRQNRYTRIRLANALASAGALDRLFPLDCTDLNNWQDSVVEPATRIARTFLRGEELPRPADVSAFAGETLAKVFGNGGLRPTERVVRVCRECEKTMMTEKEWLGHISSRSHKKVLAGIRKRALNAEKQNVNADFPS